MLWLFQSLLFVFCFGPGNLVSQSSSTPLMVNGVLGESVILPLELSAGEMIASITWLCNGTSLAFIEPSETKSPNIRVTHPKQRKRLNFTQSYSLKLSNLEMEDTGSYSAQITTETSVKLSSYTLRIFNVKIQYTDTKMILFVVFGICIVTGFIIMLLLVLRKRRDSLPLSTQRTQGPAEPAGNIEYVSVSPVNNTVYASVTHSNRETEISTPMKNATVTIYSTVNHSKESKPTFSRATALDNVV
ncbi:SLAM family member 6 isoform X4 [Macaca fascicularis]|uniref:SLAM family member 6 isoform X4 n=1 Tax=Macaca fascicularis TaxID=9541 RepID=UPI003D15D5DC